MNNCFSFSKQFVTDFRSLFPQYQLEKDLSWNQNNLTNNEYCNNRYLGTYFPRTVAEYWSIIEELEAHNEFVERIKNSKKLRILDLGCGQGGATWGLLEKLFDMGYHCDVTVVMLDGNQHALNSCTVLADFIAKKHQIKVDCLCFAENIKQLSGAFYSEIRKENFDFILASKSLGEMSNNCSCSRLYGTFLDYFLEYLKTNGFFILADVNIKNAWTKQFQGVMLHSQVENVLSTSKKEFIVIERNNRTSACGYYGPFEKEHIVFKTIFDGCEFNDPLCYSVITHRSFLND